MTPIRIAMWSGPRNISTALLRSWGARPDTFVSDEPLYAHYLHATGIDHPGSADVIAAGETDWRRVVEYLCGPVPNDKPIWYQKHMAHHLLPGMDQQWLGSLRNCLLIRDPRSMLASLSKVLPNLSADQTGLPQQVVLYELLSEQGAPPPIVDSTDVLRDPATMLELLCKQLDVPYTDVMLHWEPGRRDTDGSWASHWYANVWQSTGFQPYRPSEDNVPDHLQPVLDECQLLYDQLADRRIHPAHSVG